MATPPPDTNDESPSNHPPFITPPSTSPRRRVPQVSQGQTPNSPVINNNFKTHIRNRNWNRIRSVSGKPKLFGAGLVIFGILIATQTLIPLVSTFGTSAAVKTNSRIADPRSVLDNAIKKDSGNGWRIVDWKSPFTKEEEEKFSCDFVTFESASTGKSADMCVHAFRDIVSGNIRRKKRWNDCNILPEMWNTSMPDENSVYVEIGTNIGSCAMEMLLGTNASIITFEPHPMNVFNLKKTISKMDPSYQDRIKLVPIGLGDEQSAPTIFSASNNMGNSVVGTVVKDGEGQQFAEHLQFTIHVERLDSILYPGIDVKLMKMDAQGYECKIMEGIGSKLARSFDAIKFEWAKKWLDGQNCTDLIPKFHDYGFDLYRNFKQGQYINGPQDKSRVDYGHRIIDIFAKKNKSDKKGA